MAPIVGQESQAGAVQPGRAAMLLKENTAVGSSWGKHQPPGVLPQVQPRS